MTQSQEAYATILNGGIECLPFSKDCLIRVYVLVTYPTMLGSGYFYMTKNVFFKNARTKVALGTS
jgi:hypothetical protein